MFLTNCIYYFYALSTKIHAALARRENLPFLRRPCPRSALYVTPHHNNQNYIYHFISTKLFIYYYVNLSPLKRTGSPAGSLSASYHVNLNSFRQYSPMRLHLSFRPEQAVSLLYLSQAFIKQSLHFLIFAQERIYTRIQHFLLI